MEFVGMTSKIAKPYGGIFSKITSAKPVILNIFGPWQSFISDGPLCYADTSWTTSQIGN